MSTLDLGACGLGPSSAQSTPTGPQLHREEDYTLTCAPVAAVSQAFCYLVLHFFQLFFLTCAEHLVFGTLINLCWQLPCPFSSSRSFFLFSLSRSNLSPGHLPHLPFAPLPHPLTQRRWAPGTQCITKCEHMRPKPGELAFRKGDVVTILEACEVSSSGRAWVCLGTGPPHTHTQTHTYGPLAPSLAEQELVPR